MTVFLVYNILFTTVVRKNKVTLRRNAWSLCSND